MDRFLLIVSLISFFNLINNQLQYNELKSLICGAGLIEAPDLISFENSIEKESNYSPIRIYIDYTNFDQTSSSYSNISNSKTLIKEKLSRAAYLMEQIIKVQRFKSNLILTEEMIQKHNLNSYDTKLITGIPYDLIIFPKFKSYTYRTIYNSMKYINFHGYPLIIDSNTKRPITGIIDIYNLDYSNMGNLNTYLINSFIHQLIHIMVFDSKLINIFPNYNSPPIGSKIDYTGYQYRYFITSPKVFEYTKRHFNCSINVIGLQLDNSGFNYLNSGQIIYHWEPRFMTGDIMSPFPYEEESISEITLALFEDSNWYKVNYYTGGLFRYGKGETCWFINGFCITTSYSNTSFPNHFCLNQNEQRCTAGRTQRGICRMFNDEMIPSYFQYFQNDTTLGGKNTAHYCPKTESEYLNNNVIHDFYPGSCLNGIIPSYSQNLAEVNSDHSFCAISNIIPNDPEYANLNTRRAVCYPMFCTNTTLTIQIGNIYMTCPKLGGVVRMSSDSGYIGAVECPDYNLICTGSVMCNSIESCIEKKSIVKDSSFIYNNYTYVYQRLDMIEYSHIKSIGELSYDGKCGINCLYCKDGNTCMKCRDGEYVMGSNSKTRGDTTKLFCDLITNFQKSTNYELDNEIYYIIDENYEGSNNDDNEESDTDDKEDDKEGSDTNDNEGSDMDDKEGTETDDNEESGTDNNEGSGIGNNERDDIDDNEESKTDDKNDIEKPQVLDSGFFISKNVNCILLLLINI